MTRMLRRRRSIARRHNPGRLFYRIQATLEELFVGGRTLESVRARMRLLVESDEIWLSLDAILRANKDEVAAVKMLEAAVKKAGKK